MLPTYAPHRTPWQQQFWVSSHCWCWQQAIVVRVSKGRLAGTRDVHSEGVQDVHDREQLLLHLAFVPESASCQVCRSSHYASSQLSRPLCDTHVCVTCEFCPTCDCCPTLTPTEDWVSERGVQDRTRAIGSSRGLLYRAFGRFDHTGSTWCYRLGFGKGSVVFQRHNLLCLPSVSSVHESSAYGMCRLRLPFLRRPPSPRRPPCCAAAAVMPPCCVSAPPPGATSRRLRHRRRFERWQ
jgi:hypothetical protein